MGKMGWERWGTELTNVIKRKWHISVRIWKGSRLRKRGRETLRPRIVKCDKENVAYFNKDLEGLQIGENGPGGTGAQNRQM